MKQVVGGARLFSGFSPAISGLPILGEPSSAKSTRWRKRSTSADPVPALA